MRDEGQGGEFLDLAFVDAGLRLEVELLQGLLERQPGELGAGVEVAPAADSFGVEQVGEELSVGDLPLAGGSRLASKATAASARPSRCSRARSSAIMSCSRPTRRRQPGSGLPPRGRPPGTSAPSRAGVLAQGGRRGSGRAGAASSCSPAPAGAWRRGPARRGSPPASAGGNPDVTAGVLPGHAVTVAFKANERVPAHPPLLGQERLERRPRCRGCRVVRSTSSRSTGRAWGCRAGARSPPPPATRPPAGSSPLGL